MHQVYKTRGFVFKKSDRSDADRIFSVFAQDFGRIEVFAKSIRAIASKLKGGIETFCISDIEFIQGKNHKTLTNVFLIEKYKDIVAVPEKMEIAMRVCFLLDNIIKEQELDQNIWNLIIGFFEKLNTCVLPANNFQLTYDYFFWNFISLLGYKPQLFACAHCGQKLDSNNLYFSNKEGGVICAVCLSFNKNSKEINSDIVKVLRLFLENDWQTILKLKISPVSFALLQEISGDYHGYLSSVLI